VPGGGVAVDTRFERRCRLRGRQAERGYGDGYEEGESPEGHDWVFALVLHVESLRLCDDEVTLQTL
jgi:hypothetical protein